MVFLSLLILWFALLFGFLLFLPGLISVGRLEVECASAFECGFSPAGASHVPFCIKFFLICLFFILFDLEVLYLFPAVSRSGLLLPFVLVLIIGTVLEYGYGSLDWVL
ncbi:MAG: hypothetical protein CMJ58_14350 [Planctomycetaceae bacterium]|nr:hypothetical protein [Planctomycetaceae bacterium]